MYATTMPGGGLTMRLSFGESASSFAAPPMAQPGEKALASANPVAAPVVMVDSGAAARSLDQAMDRYAQGDDAAYAEVFRQAAPRIQAFLTRLCGQRALAEDLAQEALLRIHLARGSFLSRSAALPWMFAIARNAFLDHTRREGVRRAVRQRASESADGGRASPETMGEHVVAARETLDLVRRTLEALPVSQREAFVLLRFEGLSVSEAAAVVGATEAAVKVRAFRAYEALRAALGGEGEGSSRRR